MKFISRLRRLRLPFILLALLLVTGCGFYASSGPASAASGPAQQAIEIAAAQPDIVAALAHFPKWSAEAEEDDPDENRWNVTFFEDQEKEEWLGDAVVDLDEKKVLEYSVPIFLTPEEETRQKAQVEALVLADPQALALLGDLDDWEQYTNYDPYEVGWSVLFEHGLDAWEVIVEPEEDGGWLIERIQDPYAFTEEEKQRADRDKAIELAAESDAVWAALEDVDDWTAFASPLTDEQWGVSVIAAGKEVYYLRVDIEAWKIIEEGPQR